MAGEDWAQTSPVAQQMRAAPYEFDFFQAVRRIESSHPAMPRIGCSARPAEDPLRFGQEPSVAFAPSTLASFGQGSKEGRAPRMLVYFFGLLGPNGPMPLHFTEYVRDRMRNNSDPTLARFMDVFHHRMLCLLYRAWAVSEPTVSFDRPGEDRFAFYVGSMFGMGMSELRGRDAVPDLAKLHYAGRLSSPTKNAEGLRAVIGDYFEVPAEVEQFVGHWVNLSSDAVFRLGESPWTGSLGTTAVLGERIWDCQQKFRVKLGPLRFSDYAKLLPGTPGFKRLVAWVRNYIGDELSWDLHLILKASEVPQARLGQFGNLGWSAWVSSKPFEKDEVSTVSDPCSFN